MIHNTHDQAGLGKSRRMKNNLADASIQGVEKGDPIDEVSDNSVKGTDHVSNASSQASSEQKENSQIPGLSDVEVGQGRSSDDELRKIPHSQRRGLFGRFTILAEVDEPKLYSRNVKWFITFVVAMAAIAAPLGSTIIFRKWVCTLPLTIHLQNIASLSQIADDLHTTPTITNLSAALYMLAMSIFPLWWSSFSETLGRRSIYLVSFILFLIWNVLAAISHNIAMLIVMRILGGGAAASVQAVGAGTIADIWEVKERGRAMGIFYLGPLCGPLLGPVVGGALAQRFGWRSAQWFLAIYGGVLLIFIFFALPEVSHHGV